MFEFPKHILRINEVMVANSDRNGVVHVSAEQKVKDQTCVF